MEQQKAEPVALLGFPIVENPNLGPLPVLRFITWEEYVSALWRQDDEPDRSVEAPTITVEGP